MKLSRINRWFRTIGILQLRYRRLLLLFLTLMTVIAATGLSRVTMESSNSGWFEKADAIEVATQEFEERFGNNENIGILVEAEDVFAPEVLTMIRNLGDELLARVPYADEITSLTELEISLGTEEGIEVINPLEDGIPSDPEELEAIKKLVLSRQAVVNKLVSDDATETWISLSLREFPEEEEWAETGLDPLYETGEVAISVITDPRWQSDAYTIKAAGMPYTETEEKDFMAREASLRVLSGFVVMILLLAVFLRSLRGVLVPVFTTAAGIMVVFGCMGWLKIGVDSMLMTLPLLLGMALSVGYSIHLVNAFKQVFSRTGDRKAAAVSAVEKTGWPILFTVFTTMGSMASFAIIGIKPIRWLGLSCAAVVLTVFVYVFTLIPILMSFGKDRPRKKLRKTDHTTGTEAFFSTLGEWVLRRRRGVSVFFIVAALIALPGFSRINVNVDGFEFMGLKVPYIQRVYSIATSKLGSYLTYNITFKFDEPDAIKDPEVLRRFEMILDRVGEFELTKKSAGVPKIFSILDIVKEMNQTLNEDDPACYDVPDGRDMIAQLLFLYEISGGTKTYKWVDEEYSLLRGQVNVSRFDSSEISYELEQIEAMAEELIPEADLAVVGSAVRFAAMNDKIVIGELKSFLAALFIIAILLALVFTSITTGLIGLIPNITPVIAIGGVMGYFDFQLDMMTMVIMPMLLGIAVDDTIHFINQIKYEFEITGDYHTAIINAFAGIGKTLAMTTVILSFSFGAYAFSTVQTLHHVGLLAPLGLITALVADYLMTPALIIITKPFGQEFINLPGPEETENREPVLTKET
ncbi:MMPL family transporter [Marispirochaeta sp.]|uniref:efflux RND transporter permease subunit n=1 Tax=Marispirochaeta sp. TaxID=2038653 RepID=UPI0029C9322E|nr:MMPL family transporter [Marispirochaeta sp.]